jgi:hypothetical protein
LNPTDAGLLQQMRQSVFPPGQPGADSVHFILMNGAVRLTGTVPNSAEQKRIEAAVSRLPGVTKVYDALSVPGQVTAQSEAPGQLVPTNTVVSGAAPTNTPNTAPLPPTGYQNGAGPTNPPARVP